MNRRDQFYVSEINFLDQVRKTMCLPERVYVTDETIREGEETPGATMSIDDKVAIALMLEEIGVYETNVGYVNYIEDHAEAAKRIKKECPKLKTSCYIRAFGKKDLKEEVKKEVDFALELGVDQIAILIPASNYQLKIRNLSQENILEDSVIAVESAKNCGASVTYAPYDTTRTDISYLKNLLTSAIIAGANRVLLYDTLGVMNPQATVFWMNEIKKVVKAPIQFHAHSDFNLSVANTCAAVIGGAEYIDIVINGLGDRAGNCSFEETVMALEGLYRINTGIKTEGLFKLCKKVEEITGIGISRNKAICGENTFIHESDIHVHAVLSGNAAAFEPYEPSIVGQKRVVYFGSTTSTDSVEMKGESLGMKLSPEEIKVVMGQIRTRIKDKGFATEEEVEKYLESIKFERRGF
ncbi:MAG: 2-isopropylmalate synthase [Thermodesulfobacteriota bacterium]